MVASPEKGRLIGSGAAVAPGYGLYPFARRIRKAQFHK
jgi:hypothetical protein